MEEPNPLQMKSTPEIEKNNCEEFYNLGEYYLKILYNEKEELSMTCYNIEKLDGICYELRINLKDIYLLSNWFKQYKSIKDIYKLFINAIKEKKYEILSNDSECNLKFTLLLNDNKYINMPLSLTLSTDSNSNNLKEYIKVLSNEIKNLRNKYSNDIDELKNEIFQIKGLINNNSSKENIIEDDNKNIITHSQINNHGCIFCGSGKDLRKCICKKIYCIDCISNNKNNKCKKQCYLFNNNLNILTSFYQISKFPLPKNFEAKLYLTKVEMIRVGITFDSGIINEKNNHLDSPKYVIYYKGQISKAFYCYNKGWIDYFNIGKNFESGDDLIIRVKEGKLSYYLNNQSMGDSYPLEKEDIDNKIMFLLIHRRDSDSNCQLEYIYELFD